MTKQIFIAALAADHAVFRNGVWCIRQSESGAASYLSWGIAADTLVPADYDGDGRADAIYRDGIWFTQQSSAGIKNYAFGLPTDIPAPTGYVP